MAHTPIIHKAVRLLILTAALTMVTTACQRQAAAVATETAPVAPTGTPAQLPTPMLTVATPTRPPGSPTAAATFTATAPPTDTPAPSPTARPNATATAVPPCFVSDAYAFAFNPDGSRLLLRGETGLQSLDLQTREVTPLLKAPPGLRITAAALSPDGTVLAQALDDYTIQLIRLTESRFPPTLAGHTAPVTRLRFSPAGDRLYSASQDGWVRAWDMSGQEVGAFQPQAGSAGLFDIEGLAVSPDGKLLATVPMDGAVTLWDASDFDLIRPLGANGGYAYSAVGFSPDGQLLVAGTVNGLYLWRTIDGTELLGGNPGINSDVAAFSPDGRYLAYAEIAEQYDLVLASPDGSQELRRWAAHTTPIWELFFSPDTTLLVSAGVETRLWRVDTGELVLVGAPTCP